MGSFTHEFKCCYKSTTFLPIRGTRSSTREAKLLSATQWGTPRGVHADEGGELPLARAATNEVD